MLFDLGLLQQWAIGSHASKNEGKLVINVVLCDSRFWKSIHYCFKCVTPNLSCYISMKLCIKLKNK